LPDYVTAINARFSRGLRPEHNAAAAIRCVIGPASIPDSLLTEYYRLLELPLPQAADSFLVPYGIFFKSQPEAKEAEIYEGLDPALRGPWRAADLPVIARWLQVSHGHLDALVEATKLSRAYFPAVASRSTSGPRDFPLATLMLEDLREIGKALCARAMLRLGSGEIEAAFQDLQACHRLARLLDTSGPTSISGLVALSIESLAFDADRHVARYGRLSSEQALQFGRRLASVPPLTGVFTSLDTIARYEFLDTAMTVAVNGPESLDDVFSTQHGRIRDCRAVVGIPRFDYLGRRLE
jgi:hypothetical protein